MPRTGAYVGDLAVFHGESDPITLAPLEETAHPVVLGNDHRHFYDLVGILKCLDQGRRHPMTQERMTIHDVHALLTPSPTANLMTYFNTVRVLAIRGQRELTNNHEELASDLRAWCALKKKPAGWPALFLEYMVEEVQKAFQFSVNEDPAIVGVAEYGRLPITKKLALRNTQWTRMGASYAHNANGQARRAVRETYAVRVHLPRPPLWPFNEFGERPGAFSMRDVPLPLCTRAEEDIADRFVTVRWYSCMGRPNQTFQCERMAEELERMMRRVLGPRTEGGWPGPHIIQVKARVLWLLKQRLPIHPALEPPCFVLHWMTPADQLRGILRLRLEEEGEERLRMLGTGTPLTPEEWIETLIYPILARQQQRLAWVDYGIERYFNAVGAHADLRACFAQRPARPDVPGLRFIPEGVRALQPVPSYRMNTVRHDDASMDAEEIRQITNTPSVGDAPFYYNLRLLDMPAPAPRRR